MVAAPARFVCPACGLSYAQGGFCPTDGKPLGATDDPLIGSDVGRYRLAKLLGEGGMGRVYLAVQPQIGSRVAVKVLSDRCARSPDLLERFFAEARAVNLIRHEGIVNVIDMAQLTDGRPYIVMEFVEGGTLADALRAGPLPLGGLVQVASEVCSALAAAHAIGIVHRDLKPDNVLVTVEGHAKVLDFGIAKLAPELQSGLSPRTQTGALLGTPHYMAPEQISGATQLDARADIYAAGVMLFEAMTGKRPFAGDTLFDLMRMHLEAAPPSIRELRPDVPLAMERVVHKAMAKQPGDRFQTVTELARALHESAATLPPEAWRPLSSRGSDMPLMSRSSGGATVPVEPKPEARRGAWIAGGALAIVAGVIVVATRSKTDDAVVVVAPPPPPVVQPEAPHRAPPAAPAPVAESRKPVVVVAQAHPDTKAKTEAAKHGVIIGDHVMVGPNVVIGGGATAQRLSRAADYDPKHFDAKAYAGKALALARTIYPDAGFVRMDMVNVYPDGHADLTLTDDTASYLFRSPSHSARPPDLPANLPVELTCYVEVTVGPKEVEARARGMDPVDPSCRWPIRSVPACPLAGVWAQAIAVGAATNTIAKVELLADGKWFFDNENDGTGFAKSFPDRCP